MKNNSHSVIGAFLEICAAGFNVGSVNWSYVHNVDDMYTMCMMTAGDWGSRQRKSRDIRARTHNLQTRIMSGLHPEVTDPGEQYTPPPPPSPQLTQNIGMVLGQHHRRWISIIATLGGNFVFDMAPEKTGDFVTMVGQCWASVADGGPALSQPLCWVMWCMPHCLPVVTPCSYTVHNADFTNLLYLAPFYFSVK